MAGLSNSTVNSSLLTRRLTVQAGGGGAAWGILRACWELTALRGRGPGHSPWGSERVVSTLVPLCPAGDLAKASGFSVLQGQDVATRGKQDSCGWSRGGPGGRGGSRGQGSSCPRCEASGWKPGCYVARGRGWGETPDWAQLSCELTCAMLGCPLGCPLWAVLVPSAPPPPRNGGSQPGTDSHTVWCLFARE